MATVVRSRSAREEALAAAQRRLTLPLTDLLQKTAAGADAGPPGYRPADFPWASCAACRHFQAAASLCTRYHARVEPEATCDGFEARELTGAGPANKLALWICDSARDRDGKAAAFIAKRPANSAGGAGLGKDFSASPFAMAPGPAGGPGAKPPATILPSKIPQKPAPGQKPAPQEPAPVEPPRPSAREELLRSWWGGYRSRQPQPDEAGMEKLAVSTFRNLLSIFGKAPDVPKVRVKAPPVVPPVPDVVPPVKTTPAVTGAPPANAAPAPGPGPGAAASAAPTTGLSAPPAAKTTPAPAATTPATGAAAPAAPSAPVPPSRIPGAKDQPQDWGPWLWDRYSNAGREAVLMRPGDSRTRWAQRGLANTVGALFDPTAPVTSGVVRGARLLSDKVPGLGWLPGTLKATEDVTLEPFRQLFGTKAFTNLGAYLGDIGNKNPARRQYTKWDVAKPVLTGTAGAGFFSTLQSGDASRIYDARERLHGLRQQAADPALPWDQKQQVEEQARLAERDLESLRTGDAQRQMPLANINDLLGGKKRWGKPFSDPWGAAQTWAADRYRTGVQAPINYVGAAVQNANRLPTVAAQGLEDAAAGARHLYDWSQGAQEASAKTPGVGAGVEAISGGFEKVMAKRVAGQFDRREEDAFNRAWQLSQAPGLSPQDRQKAQDSTLKAYLAVKPNVDKGTADPAFKALTPEEMPAARKQVEDAQAFLNDPRRADQLSTYYQVDHRLRAERAAQAVTSLNTQEAAQLAQLRAAGETQLDKAGQQRLAQLEQRQQPLDDLAQSQPATPRQLQDYKEVAQQKEAQRTAHIRMGYTAAEGLSPNGVQALLKGDPNDPAVQAAVAKIRQELAPPTPPTPPAATPVAGVAGAAGAAAGAPTVLQRAGQAGQAARGAVQQAGQAVVRQAGPAAAAAQGGLQQAWSWFQNMDGAARMGILGGASLALIGLLSGGTLLTGLGLGLGALAYFRPDWLRMASSALGIDPSVLGMGAPAAAPAATPEQQQGPPPAEAAPAADPSAAAADPAAAAAAAPATAQPVPPMQAITTAIDGLTSADPAARAQAQADLAASVRQSPEVLRGLQANRTAIDAVASGWTPGGAWAAQQELAKRGLNLNPDQTAALLKAWPALKVELGF